MQNDTREKTTNGSKKRAITIIALLALCAFIGIRYGALILEQDSLDPNYAAKPKESSNILSNITDAVFSDFGISKKANSKNQQYMNIENAQIRVVNVQHNLLGFVLEGEEKVLSTKIESGDTISLILNNWLTGYQINEIVELSKPHHPLTRLNINKPYTITVDLNNNFKRFEYERDIDNTFILDAEIIDLVQNNATNPSTFINVYEFSAALLPTVYDIELAYVKADINYSLFESLISAGEGVSLANTMVDVFSYQIDFFRDLRVGDSFEILVEKKYKNGVFKSYGKMLAATFTNQGHEFVAYRFAQDGVIGAYYDEEGEALERLLLRVPLSFTRISSGFTLARKHPILNITRPHMGIDYAAPKGTPVYTIGDGVVTHAAWLGDYGYTVIVRHTNGYESQYAHLSGFHSSVHKGARVTRGSTIGYVGSTGLSTGPHLDFRLKHNGKFINPNSLSNIPKAPPITADNKEKFALQVSIINQYLKGDVSLAMYEAGKVLPDELEDIVADDEDIEALSSL